MESPSKNTLNLEQFVPSLQELFRDNPPNLANILRAAAPAEGTGDERTPVPVQIDRHEITIIDGDKNWSWRVNSLQELFRGSARPPALGDHPQQYESCFLVLEVHVHEMGHLFGEPRDREMLEIYAQLRKRPDGKSLGFAHDIMWRAAALMLGTHVLSQAEFEAIIGRLERSCRRFEQGSTSRNYAHSLHMLFHGA